MTVYEQVKALLELNTLRGVGVQNKGKEWMVFTHLRPDGVLEGTLRQVTIEKCLSSGLSSAQSFTEQELNQESTHNIVPIPMKPKVLPMGTKVKILDIVEEVGRYTDWCSDSKKVRKGIIVKTCDEGRGVFYEVKSVNVPTDVVIVPAYCVVPDFSEESEAHKKAEELEKQAEDMLKKAKKLRESL